MENSKHTKRSLIASLLSVMLCMAMLIGSTFAWFTDNVTSGKNKIVAGNLDIELNYKNVKMAADGENFAEVLPTTENLFVNSEGNDIRWEPGATAVTYLELKNAGNLALKYILSVDAKDTVVGEDGAALSKVLKTAVVEIQVDEVGTYDRAKAVQKAEAADAKNILGYKEPGEMTEQGQVKYFAMIVYFPEEITNEYEGVVYNRADIELKTELSLNLVATQMSHENDSFDNQYDVNAAFPVLAANFSDALTGGGSLALTEDITIPNTGNPEIITMADGTALDLNGKTISSNNMGLILQGKNATVKNGNFVGLNDASYGLFIGDMGETESIVLENVTLKGGLNVFNASQVILRNCEIHGTKFHTVWADENAQIIIESGTYYVGTGANSHVLWTASDVSDGDCGLNEIIVKGGSFEQDPTPYVDTAVYDVTLDTTTNMYVVTPKA